MGEHAGAHRRLDAASEAQKERVVNVYKVFASLVPKTEIERVVAAYVACALGRHIRNAC